MPYPELRRAENTATHSGCHTLILRPLLCMILFTAVLTPGSAQNTQQQLDRSFQKARKAPDHYYGEQTGDLPNFHEVHQYLLRGGQPTQEGLQQLKNKRVSTIIDLRGLSEQHYDEGQLAEKLGLKYINLPMTSQPPTERQVNTFIQAVEAAQKGATSGPVFVHCAHGSDRTGCLVGIWRVTHDHFSYDQAYEEMRKYYFTPKFTRLSGAVKEYALSSASTLSQPASTQP